MPGLAAKAGMNAVARGKQHPNTSTTNFVSVALPITTDKLKEAEGRA